MHTDFQMMPLYRSVWPLPGGVVSRTEALGNAVLEKKLLESIGRESGAPVGMYKLRCAKHSKKGRQTSCIAESADVSAIGKANGKRENSSTTTNMYDLWVLDGRGPLKSTLNRSNTPVALTSVLEV